MWFDERAFKMPLVVVDFEFCVSACGERIVPYQIGACMLHSNLKFVRYMQMDEPVRECVTAPHVDDAWLLSRGAVPASDAMRAFVEWLVEDAQSQYGVILLAHNAFSADAFLLSQLLRRASIAAPFCFVLDTLAFCRFAFRGDATSFSQDALAQRYLRTTPQTHSADADATVLAALLRFARMRTPISGIAMPLGSVPITCARSVGPTTAALLLQHGVPIEVSAFASFVRAHGWPAFLPAKVQSSLANVVCSPPTPDAMLRQLACQLSL